MNTFAVCDVCGQEFYRWHRIKTRVCSTSCATSRQREASHRWHERHYTPVRSPLHGKTCSQCGAAFESKRSDALFCSVLCRVRTHREGLAARVTAPRITIRGASAPLSLEPRAR
ncbi:MAG: hypothetical protein IPN24_18480 [Betaproteobacteria bacterium]|nr:hypothetical protein [Betaproteobacteria bacterium]